MTKGKIIQDLVSHSKDAYYAGNGYVCNGCVIYRDRSFPEIETQVKILELKKLEEFVAANFADSILRDLSDAITIDREVLDKWIKEHRRNDPERVPFIIAIKEAFGNTKYICVNAWFLRDQLEYVKNNRIFIQPSKFRYRYNDAMYIGGIFSFSDDFNTTECMTLPVNWQGTIEPAFTIVKSELRYA